MPPDDLSPASRTLPPSPGPARGQEAPLAGRAKTAAQRKGVEPGGAYAWYILLVLFVVYTVGSFDRQILSILAEQVKKDLRISDAQLGFMYGTAFGVFYAIFGIPLGRLADFVSRRTLLAVGLALWSATTVASGLSGDFLQLASARIGVGIGEATAGPCSYSILSDCFPRARRAWALALFASGIYLGSGLSKVLGGLLVARWPVLFPHGAPFGLTAWQAAFVLAGSLGLGLAAWVLTLREPVRGASEGRIVPKEPRPWRRSLLEFASAIPPLTVLNMAQVGRRALAANLLVALALAVAAMLLIRVFGDAPQWITLAAGLYCTSSWVQALKHRDPATFAMIFGSSVYCCSITGFALLSLINASIGFWAAPYAIRTFHASAALVGVVLGISAAAGGLLGVVLGGRLSDWLLPRNPSARLLVGVLSGLGMLPGIVEMLVTRSLAAYLAAYVWYTVIGCMWVGGAAATSQDLVLPRMRGAAAASNVLAFTLIGVCIGPYFVGKISTATGDLRLAMFSCLLALPIALFCFWRIYRTLPLAEQTRIERAAAAGETALST